jgi:hypothetical protein
MTKVELAKFLLEYEQMVENSIKGVSGQVEWAQRVRVAGAKVVLQNALKEASAATILGTENVPE